ncbi:hypothetical protein EKG37_04455 [Robertmurraya yapensis]|uniref:Uncharacterized protein n=2 Tax=Bacillaceae TaxID=186817 RepID=A0A3S0J050_9BACI|nr:hypothetical protein [Bacillus yapensis]RTR35142.1 hypothetical protein EKG37_04455 [Bacillus yapensis]TKS97651.1 hypothetical protein FAR12_04455 [Bacillus yapensis]
MENHALSELRLLNQLLLGIIIATNIGFFLFLYTSSFPGLSYVGIGIGASIILWCWLGNRCLLFVFGFIATTTVFTITYEWTTIFH